MKKTDTLLKNNSGMSMVEVLMGFVLLVILLGMVSGIISTSTNIYYSSVDLRRAEESMQKVIYSNKAQEIAQKQDVTLKLVPAEGMPGAGDDISMTAELYKISGKDAAGDEAEEDIMDINVFFMKEP